MNIQLAQDWDDVNIEESDKMFFLATVKNGTKELNNIKTEIIIPKKRGGKFRISITGHPKITNLIHRIRHFDLTGSFYNTTSKTSKTNIILKNAWISKLESQIYADMELSRALVQAPEFRIEENYDSEPDNFKEVILFISKSSVLKEWGNHTYSYDGTVKKNKSRNISVSLKNGLEIEFTSHYSHIFKRDSIVTIPNQVGLVTGIENEEGLKSQISSLEVFFLLVSFVENKRSNLLGYSLRAPHQSIDYYFLNKTIVEFDESHDDFSIPRPQHTNFLNQCHNFFLESHFREAIRQAINRIVSPPDILEYAFITRFSALETILDAYKNYKENGFIFNDNWQVFSKKIKQFVKSTQLETPLTSEQRKEIYNKLPELNRRSFLSVMEEFIAEYKLNIEDLWTLVGSPNRNTLLDIRNKLVHGAILKSGAYEILWKAEENLCWILKRMIMVLLGWDYNLSSIRPDTLKRSLAYTEWKELIKSDGIFENA